MSKRSDAAGGWIAAFVLCLSWWASLIAAIVFFGEFR